MTGSFDDPSGTLSARFPGVTSVSTQVVAMRARVSRDDGGALISIAGTFGLADVEELAVLAGGLCSRVRVVLDFRRADAIDDCAIAKLASELHGQRGQIVLVGLSEHHHRLLQYVGEEAPYHHAE